MKSLPVTAIIPTRNSMALLPAHLAAMNEVLARCAEVVAVDSFSTDGTAEFLQKKLRHPRVKFLTHPPGLYQSWNFAITQAGEEFTYMSTVGDSLTVAGLQRLVEAAQKLRCDALASPPVLQDARGRTITKRWPVHQMIAALDLRREAVLDPATTYLYAVSHLPGGVLGSSASNLYRTRCLQAAPFPVDFGIAGDVAWGLQNLGCIRFGILPEVCSTFLYHPKPYSLTEYAMTDKSAKFLALARAVIAHEPSATAHPLLDAVLAEQVAHNAAENRLNRIRARSKLWLLQPAAWWARSAREWHKRRIEKFQTSEIPRLARLEYS